MYQNVEEGSNHQVTIFRCPARQKAQALVWKSKVKKVQDRKEEEIQVQTHQKKKAIPKPIKIELDTRTDWVGSPRHFSDLSFVKNSKPKNA